jgi:hypothetical protein
VPPAPAPGWSPPTPAAPPRPCRAPPPNTTQTTTTAHSTAASAHWSLTFCFEVEPAWCGGRRRAATWRS